MADVTHTITKPGAHTSDIIPEKNQPPLTRVDEVINVEATTRATRPRRIHLLCERQTRAAHSNPESATTPANPTSDHTCPPSMRTSNASHASEHVAPRNRTTSTSSRNDLTGGENPFSPGSPPPSPP